MKLLRYLTISTILLSFSCQKEVTNDNYLIGQWIEKGKIGGCSLEFNNNGSAFLKLSGNDNVQEYAYRIYEDTNSIFFSIPDNTDSEGSFRYSYDDKTKELTIWGLYISIPENPSTTILTKVQL